MITNRLVRIGVFVLACLQAGAFAQGDERARELLEGITAVTPRTFHTLQQVMTVTMEDGFATRTQHIIDFDNRRAIIYTDIGDSQATMRHVDGRSEMIMDGEVVEMPSLPGGADPFALIFEPSLLEFDIDDATYDGFITYGDLVSGEQVTTTGAFTALGLPANATMSFVFAENGDMLAGVSDLDDGTKLIVMFDGIEGVDGAWDTVAGFKMLTYEFDGDTVKPYATMEFEPAIVDEPLDESLFD